MSMTSPFASRLPLPLDIEQITSDWLTHALSTPYPGVAVKSSEIVDVIHGTCTKIRIRLEINGVGRQAGIPQTVILKGGFEPHSRDMYLTHDKEVRAYADLLPALRLHSPKCYFADRDEELLQGIVIIEDLVASGVRFCHPLKPQTHEQVARRLTALAHFHANSWDTPDLKPGGKWSWVKDILLESCVYMKRYLQTEIWQHFIGLPRGAAASVRFHDMEWMQDSLDRLPRLAGGLPRCVLHGDTHLGNLYEESDGTPGFFDPAALCGPSMVEVAYHIAGAVDPMDRRRWEGALVRHYLDELARCGIDAPGFDEAMRQYAAYLALGYLIFLINESYFQPEEINTAYTARFSAAMIDNRTQDVLEGITTAGVGQSSNGSAPLSR